MEPTGSWSSRIVRQIDGNLEGLLARWMRSLARRSWKLRTGTTSPVPDGVATLTLLRDRCEAFLTSLRGALEMGRGLRLGAPEHRDAIQLLSFTAGWMSGVRLPISDAVALVQGLEESILEVEGVASFVDGAAEGAENFPEGDELKRYFQGLMVVVTEAYAASLDQRAGARYRDAMEKSQLVCDLHPRLPFLFLVGDPDRHALEDATGRVMMLAAMREARVVVVDGSGLIWPERVLPEAHLIITEHARAAAVKVVLSGVPLALRKELRPAAEVVSVHEALAEAARAAAEAGGLSWSLPPE